MEIVRKSQFTGITRTRDIEVTNEQIDRWRNGELIQNAMPELSADDRDFIMTGLTPEDWDMLSDKN